MSAKIFVAADALEFDADGLVDSKGVKFLGSAKKREDGTWHCLAIIGDALAIVELRLTEIRTKPA